MTKDEVNNVHLFNVIEQKIEESCTLAKQVADNIYVNIGRWLDNDSLIISIGYANKAENGFLKNTGTDYFQLSF